MENRSLTLQSLLDTIIRLSLIFPQNLFCEISVTHGTDFPAEVCAAT